MLALDRTYNEKTCYGRTRKSFFWNPQSKGNRVRSKNTWRIELEAEVIMWRVWRELQQIEGLGMSWLRSWGELIEGLEWIQWGLGMSCLRLCAPLETRRKQQKNVILTMCVPLKYWKCYKLIVCVLRIPLSTTKRLSSNQQVGIPMWPQWYSTAAPFCASSNLCFSPQLVR